MNITIVICAYNRPLSLKRLLGFIDKSNYNSDSIDLYISIDGGGGQNAEVINIAESFTFRFGKKHIIKQDVNIGLKKHILSCGDLVEKYDGIILLEEDIVLSPDYYGYTLQAVTYYENDNNISGIALYKNNLNESSWGIPFFPAIDRKDVFFMQVPCSWGQAWTKKQWQKFRSFYNENEDFNFDTIDLPLNVKYWPSKSSWKKYFFAYMVINNLYFVYPTIAFSSNWGDVGQHFEKAEDGLQVPLSMNKNNINYNFVAFIDSANRYDAYMEIEPDCLRALGFTPNKSFIVDMYGAKEFSKYKVEYALSLKSLKNNISDSISFSANMLPLVNNIIYNIQGDVFNFAPVSLFEEETSTEKKEILISKIIGYSYVFIKDRYTNLYKKSLYYKIGYYLMHPSKGIVVFMRKIFNIK